MPNSSLRDGSLKLVEQLVSLLDIAGTPVATNYILKKGSLATEVKEIDSEDQNGAHRGSAFAKGKTSGSMTLQFVGNSDKMPQPLQYFSATDASGAAVKLILKKVGQSFGAFEEAMVECDIQLAVGTITATLPSLTAT